MATLPGPRVRISLCMIARDEQEVLARCLGSVRPYVDEIVIVDTGSTDRSVDLARRAGARVSFFRWDGDFAAARNDALDQATGEWILSLDADEVLEPGSGTRLREIVELSLGHMRTFSILVHNLHDREEVPLLYLSYAKRLFSRHPRVRWTRRIHEQIVHLDNEDFLEHVLTDQIVITHYGYRRDIWEGKSKAQRNLAMLRRAIAFEPDRPYPHVRIANTFLALGRVDEARSHLQRVLDRLPDHEEANVVMADCLLARQDVATANARLTDLITRNPSMVRARARLADLFADTRQLDGARELLAAGVDLAPRSGLLYQKLGVTASYLRRYDDAIGAFTTALSLDAAVLRSHVGCEAARILGGASVSNLETGTPLGAA